MKSPQPIDSSIELLHVETSPQDENEGGVANSSAPVPKSTTGKGRRLGISSKSQSRRGVSSGAAGGSDGGDPPKRPTGSKRKLPDDAPAFIRLRKKGTF